MDGIVITVKSTKSQKNILGSFKNCKVLINKKINNINDNTVLNILLLTIV